MLKATSLFPDSFSLLSLSALSLSYLFPAASLSPSLLSSLSLSLSQGWNNSLSGSIQNTGHSIQFTPSTLNQPLMVAHNGSYSLSQFHIHWGASAEEGSEHTIDGKSYSGEIHFVLHKSTGPDDAGDALSVLAVFCEANINMKIRGTPWENLCIPQDYHQICLTDSLVPSKLLPSNQDFYHYPGSLTTPPCSEIVMWYIFKQAIKIPIEFLFSLRQIKDEKNESLQYNHRCPKFNHNYPVETPDLEK